MITKVCSNGCEEFRRIAILSQCQLAAHYQYVFCKRSGSKQEKQEIFFKIMIRDCRRFVFTLNSLKQPNRISELRIACLLCLATKSLQNNGKCGGRTLSLSARLEQTKTFG